MCWLVEIHTVPATPQDVKGIKRAVEAFRVNRHRIVQMHGNAAGGPSLEGEYPDYKVGPACACDWIDGDTGNKIGPLLPVFQMLGSLNGLKRFDITWFWSEPPDSCAVQKLSLKQFYEQIKNEEVVSGVEYRVSTFQGA